MNRPTIFAAIRDSREPRRIAPAEVPVIDAFLDTLNVPREVADPLTLRVAMETVSHEAIVQEAYKDSVGVWTWGIGLTRASGVDVQKFKDKPQTIEACLHAFVERCRSVYLRDVLAEFSGYPLTEAQLAAALSFHYNTGAIKTAEWVDQWKVGKVAAARLSIMNWRTPASIIERREKERDLFFDGKWSSDGKALVIPVAKPSYQPAFSKARRVDVSAELKEALAP
jgi:lysozyme